MATTIKLPPKLKSRVARAAKANGKSSHAYMLEAIAAQTARDEARRRFIADALAAEKEMNQTGLAYRAEDVLPWFQALARGEKPPRPKPIRWRK